jgi:tRNA threonylcarbamoyl adenosine modification protein YeaZ
MNGREVILAMETAVAGGSLCILSDGVGLGSWIGDSQQVLRAEVVLIEIDRLISRVSVEKGELTQITISSGPGSFTGIRVGMATALGLAGALDIPLSSSSVMEALAFSRSHTGPVVVPVGRGTAAYQIFDRGSAVSELASIDQTSLVERFADRPVLAHSSLRPMLGENCEYEENLAAAVARFARFSPEVSTAPIFLSK